jgi:hypothetical protein
MREIERRESENGGEMLRVRERDREIGRERIREWETRRGRGKSDRSKVRYPVVVLGRRRQSQSRRSVEPRSSDRVARDPQPVKPERENLGGSRTREPNPNLPEVRSFMSGGQTPISGGLRRLSGRSTKTRSL